MSLTNQPAKLARPILAQALFVLLLCTVFGFATTGIRIDDAFIFYTYVRNIVAGQGWVFNPGEFVNGTTSTLYPLTLAVLVKFSSIPPEVLGHTLGVFALTLALLALLKVTGPWQALPILLPLIVLNSGTLDDAVGMETYLTLFLLLATLLLYTKGRFHFASLVFGLAVLSRPDSLLFGAILLIDYMIRQRRFPPLTSAIPAAILILVWLLFSKFYFGALLPNTIGAKLAQSGHAYWGGEFGFLHGAMRLIAGYGALSFLALLGLLMAVYNFRRLINNSRVLLILVWGLAYFLVYAFVIKAPPYRWYYVPLIIPYALLILIPISRTPLIAQVVFGLLLGAGAIKQMAERASAPVTAKYEIYTAAADWINQNAAPGKSIGAMEIGILGYYAKNHRVIDALGLITPAANFIEKREHGWFIKEHKPDYVITNNPPRTILEEFTKRDWFKSDYTLRTTVTTPRNRRGVKIYERRYQNAPTHDMLAKP